MINIQRNVALTGNVTLGKSLSLQGNVIGNSVAELELDYNDLINQPSINGNTLIGNKTSEELGLVGLTDLANYYLKTETYSQEEVNELISQVTGVSFEIVQSLPAVGESNKIYLVPIGGTSLNSYDEYIYINSSWEKIGSTSIDLSGYWKNQDGYENSLIAISNAEIDAITGG